MMLEKLYYRMAKIRAFESGLLKLFRLGKISGTTHTYIGQEANAVAILSLIDKSNDSIWSNHRCHGHYLEYCDDYIGLLREVLGRDNGICRGWGGSQHLNNRNFFSSGIQGAYSPIAAGYQLERSSLNNSIGIVFMGDGTLGQGVVYETLNLVSLLRIPILFVIENNGISQTTLHEDNFSGSVDGRFNGFGISGESIETTDLKVILKSAEKLIELCRVKSVPAYLHIKTIRLEAHSKGDDTRPIELVESLSQYDPLEINKKYINSSEDLILKANKEIEELFSEVEYESH